MGTPDTRSATTATSATSSANAAHTPDAACELPVGALLAADSPARST